MEWKELVIHTSQEAKEAVANILNEAGSKGVVIEEKIEPISRYGFQFGEIYDLKGEKFEREGATIKAYFLNDDQWPSLKERIIERVSQLSSFGIDLGGLQFTVNTVEATDWENEWKKYFKPFQVTEHFMIVPTWEREKVEEVEATKILMDPGMAFGTGTHPTTKLSLLALEQVVQAGDLVIDVGSGSGILSIAAALLGAEKVYSYDLDEVAVQSTKQNRDLNRLTTKISVQANDLLKEVDHDPKADVIVANILAHIILKLIADAKNQLKQGGIFITSGILQKNANDVEERLVANDFSIIDKFTEENWVTFIARKKIK